MRDIKVETSGKIHALRSNPYFNQLDEQTFQELSEYVNLREFERGETIFKEGNPGAGLHILQSGCVKLYRLSPQGTQYILRLCVENDIFNEVSTFDGGGSEINAEALESSRIWVVHPEYLRKMVATDPDFSRKVINNLSQDFRSLIRNISEMSFTRRRPPKRDRSAKSQW